MSLAQKPLLAKDRFLELNRWAHLAAGGETPVLASHQEATARFFFDKGDGMPGRVRMAETHARAKEKLASLIGLPNAEIAFFLNASDAVATALDAMDLGPGQNVVAAAGDFNSLTLNAVLAERRTGVECRLAEGSMAFGEEDLETCIDANTAAILVSHVTHLTGRRYDLARLRAAADAVGARLIVDASHALGAVPFDGTLVDALVTCTYKWLLGVHASAVFAINPDRWPGLPPRSIGWHSVELVDEWRNTHDYTLRPAGLRFEAGNPPFMPLYVLDNGLSALMESDAAAREAHVVALSGAILDVLAECDIEALTPADPGKRAGNVAFAIDDPYPFVTAMRERDILVWGGEERVRISAHVYNDMNDVDRLRTAMKANLGA